MNVSGKLQNAHTIWNISGKRSRTTYFICFPAISSFNIQSQQLKHDKRVLWLFSGLGSTWLRLEKGHGLKWLNTEKVKSTRHDVFALMTSNGNPDLSLTLTKVHLVPERSCALYALHPHWATPYDLHVVQKLSTCYSTLKEMLPLNILQALIMFPPKRNRQKNLVLYKCNFQGQGCKQIWCCWFLSLISHSSNYTGLQHLQFYNKI